MSDSCNPVKCSLSGFPVRGISQGKTLEWVSISLSRVSSWTRGWTWVSCITGGLRHCRQILYWATREALITYPSWKQCSICYALEKVFEIYTSLSSILSSSTSLNWKSRPELVKGKPSGHLCTTYSFRSIWKNCSLLFFFCKYFLHLVSRTLYSPRLSISV